MDFKLFIFDMDGTIVDSALDFDEMRRELGFPEGVPLLEHIELLSKTEPKERIEHYMSVIDKHEMKGALAASAMPGVDDFLSYLDRCGIRKAVLTRNSLEVSNLTFDKFGWKFESIISRNCVARPKPFPDGLLHICETLGVKPSECCYMGDFSFDLETAKRAGMPGVLYSPQKNMPLEEQASLVVRDFNQLEKNFEQEFLIPLGFNSNEII